MTHASAAQLFQNIPDDFLHLFADGQPHAKKVVDLLQYQKKDVAAATKLPLSSVRYDAKMPEELRERIREWAVAINLVAQFFKDEQKTLLWFRVSNPLLGGVSPRDMIRAGRFKKLRKFIETALAENLR
jgi:hypothetical protein